MGTKGTSVAEQFSGMELVRNPGATADMVQALRLRQNTIDAVVPPGLRALIDMQSSLQQLARPLAAVNLDFSRLADSVGVRHHTLDFAAGVELHRQLGRAIDVIGKFGAIQESITSAVARQAGAWRGLARAVGSLGMTDSLTHQLSRFSVLDRTIRGLVPEAVHLEWSSHLKTSALGTLGFLGQDWPAPVGLLTPIDHTLRGSVAWLNRHRDKPLLMTAALIPADETSGGTELVVEDEYVCAICDGSMVALSKAFRWVGPRRGVIRRRIFPVCPTCWEKERHDEGFLYRALGDLTPPAVQLVGIRGRGQGDGRPKGVLKLVRCEALDNDD